MSYKVSTFVRIFKCYVQCYGDIGTSSGLQETNSENQNL